MNTLRFALLSGAQLLLGFAMALIFNSLTNSVGVYKKPTEHASDDRPGGDPLSGAGYSEQYGINYFLNLLGLESVQWLSSPVVAPYSLILVDTWQNFPFVMMILLAGLQSLPTDPYDAARVDGASWLQTLRYITLPLLRPVLLVAIIVRTTDVFRIFDTVYVLTGGGPGNASEVLGTLTYRQTFTFINFVTGAALSIISLIVCCVIGMLSIKCSNLPTNEERKEDFMALRRRFAKGAVILLTLAMLVVVLFPFAGQLPSFKEYVECSPLHLR